MMIVVTLLAILAAMVIPTFNNMDHEAHVATALSNRRTIQVEIQDYMLANGQYPATIDPAWFAANEVPPNPFAGDYQWDPVQQYSGNDPSRRIPEYKLIDHSGKRNWARPIWYFSYGGDVYFRIADQGSDQDNLELFNLINGLQLTAIDQDTP